MHQICANAIQTHNCSLAIVPTVTPKDGSNEQTLLHQKLLFIVNNKILFSAKSFVSVLTQAVIPMLLTVGDNALSGKLKV